MIKIILVLCYLHSCASVNKNKGNLFNRVKRTDIDLSTCIDNFDIHKDKIIRTQDSQKMGAKYLNAIDLGSRQECLRLCCETDNCDVFVYEDKNTGSCYLFHCGPPEDFKCKFTHHVNYSSAVLAVNRHLPDLESQIKLTKHEQDLSKLRKSKNDSEPAPHNQEDRAHATITSSTTVKTQESQTYQKESPNEKRCSRYQFACRSTMECIAIYNACDGIPQCADGSDEAPELGCPELSTPPIQKTVVNNPPPEKTVISAKTQEVQPADIYHPPVPREDILQDDRLSPVNNPDFLRTLPLDQQIPLRVPQYPNQPEYNPQVSQLGWNARQNNQLYQIAPFYPGKTSHIFNHKENGLQVSGAGISSYSDNANYMKTSNYLGENYRPPMDIPTWPEAHQDDLRHPPTYNQDPSYISGIANSNIPASKQKEYPEHIQIKMSPEIHHSQKTFSGEQKKDSDRNVVETQTERTKNNYPDVVAYKMDGNDGIAQTPSGAVLSLSFGLIITCIMAVMIACRLRIVKKRTRKGGKGYAHDADYLVNGMYL